MQAITGSNMFDKHMIYKNDPRHKERGNFQTDMLNWWQLFWEAKRETQPRQMCDKAEYWTQALKMPGLPPTHSQLSVLTSHSFTPQEYLYPLPKHLAPLGTGYWVHWSPCLRCYENSWLAKLFIFPLQWSTKWCTGSSCISCKKSINYLPTSLLIPLQEIAKEVFPFWQQNSLDCVIPILQKLCKAELD